MTSARDGRDAEFSSRANDSAGCLLVVGGYRQNAGVLDGVVMEAKDRFLLSPSLGDFFELRWVDMGPRPARQADEAAGVAQLVLGLTRRPGEAARNFSALLVIDQSADAVDRVLRACQGDRALSVLKVRLYGLASKDDRPASQEQGAGVEIAIAPRGKRSFAELVAEVVRYAEKLLDDFGSGYEAGVPVEQLGRIGAVAESEFRGVVRAAAKADEAARRAERREAERREAERLEAERREAERREAERREAERLEAERREAARQEAERLESERREMERRLMADSVSEKAAEPVSNAELSRDLELREREAELRVLEAQYKEMEAQYHEALLAASADRETGTKPDTELPTGSSHGELPPGAAEAPSGTTAGSRRVDDRSSAEQIRQTKPVEEPHPEPPKPTGALADIRGTGANLLSRVRGKPAQRDGGKADPDDGVTLLYKCLAWLREGDRKGFKSSISKLRAYADAGISADERKRCRSIVIEQRLFSPGVLLYSLDVPFYDALLRVAYTMPLSYPAYCQIEDLLAPAHQPRAPHSALLEAISGGEPGDVRVTAIARYHLGQDRLAEWFRSGQIHVRALIAALAGEWDRPYHADVLYEVTLRYLEWLRGPYHQQAIRTALNAYGYLAAAVRERYPESVQHQVTVLAAFLRAAYPAGLDKEAVKEVFAVDPLTRALAQAALRVLADPADLGWAVRMFADRRGYTDIDSAQEAQLVKALTSGE